MAAERETVDRLIAHFLADRIGATFEGRIAGVTRAGLFVKLDETGADGFVPARTLGKDYFRYDEATPRADRQAPAARPIASAIRSRCGSWKPCPSPARCVSRCFPKDATIPKADAPPARAREATNAIPGRMARGESAARGGDSIARLPNSFQPDRTDRVTEPAAKDG